MVPPCSSSPHPLPSGPIPRPLPPRVSRFPFPFSLPPPLSIVLSDWSRAPESGWPIGERGRRRWAWPRRRGPQIEAASPSQPAAHSAAVAAARLRSCLRRSCGRAGVRAGGDGRGEAEKTAAEAGERRKEAAARRAQQLRQRPGSWECRCGVVVGADPAGPGRGKESPARPWRTTRNWTTNGSRISRTKAATWR